MMEDKIYYTVVTINRLLKHLSDLRYKYYRMVVKYQSYIKDKGKGKGRPRTGREDPEGE
jgi:hypothetical protein